MSRMEGTDGSLLSEEHTDVIQRAEELGMSTMGYKTKRSKWQMLAKRVKELEEAKAKEGLKDYEVFVVERVERTYMVQAKDEVEAEEKVMEGTERFRDGNADIEEVLSVKEI